jgi:pimeloyl-ACP methyl ester carboxylesterase
MEACMRESTVEAAGQTLRVLQAGDGPTVLFLHGGGGASWSPLLQHLSAHWHVVAPEHPGFGRSAIPEWMMSVGDLAFFYLDLLKALDLRQVHLVGHSLGGWLAAEMAIRSTERIRSLALLAPAGIAVPDAPFGDVFLWSPDEMERHRFHNPALAQAEQQSEATLDLDVVLQNRAALARLAWSPRLENPQLAYWLHRIEVPTLLAWGLEDRIVPFACHKPFLQEIPEAELATFAACGHALHIERAGDVGARLNAFLRGARP